MNKKKLFTIASILIVLFVLTGCSVPMDEQGNTILIDLSSRFFDLLKSGKEDLLSIIFCYPLCQAINLVSKLTGSVFVGISLVAVILNVLIVAFTLKQNIAMQKMQEIQPEIQKIQMKYEGRTDSASQQRMNYEMQQVYKKYNVNPISSLIATFIQFPIIFGMYSAVRRSAAVANGTFLGSLLSSTPKEAFANKEWALVVVYILMIVTQALSIYVPQFVAKQRAKKEAEKHHKSYREAPGQNQMMMYSMVLLIGFMMLNWPTALSLYYLIYSIINIVKTFIVDAISHKDE